jgi:hypothetical protein
VTDPRRWLPVLAVAAVCALPLRGLWYAPGPPMEEGFMLVFPELVLNGLVPNRDFLHLYGPGSLWVLAAVYQVAGVSLEAERVVGFLQQLGVVFGIFVAIRPWGRWLAAAGAVIAAVVVLPPIGLTALAWVGAVAFGLWSLHAALGDRRPRLLAAAGLLGAVALLYRPDLVVAVGASAAVVALGLHGRRRWIYLGSLAGATAAGYLVHVAMAGVGNVWRGLFLEPVFDLRGGRRLPLPPSWDAFDGFLQRAGLLAEPPWPLPAPPSPAQLSIWLLLIVLADAVLIVAGVRALRRRGDRRLLAFALFAAGLLPQALQRADSTHLAWVSCVPFGLVPAAVSELLRDRLPGRQRAAVAVAVPALAMLVLVPHFTFRSYSDYAAQSFGIRADAGTMERDGRRFHYGRPDAVRAVNELLPLVEALTEPGDRLFVGTGDLRRTPYSEAFLYYLLPELVPATRYIEMDPGVANAPDSGMAEEIASADVLILSSIRDDWVEPNESRELGPDEPNRVVARRFCQVGSFGDGLFGRGLYEVYTRRDGACR